MNYILGFLLIIFTPLVHAGFFAEPYIGYKSEDIKLTDTLNSKTEIKTSQPSYGLKLGYRSQLGIDLNIDGEFSSGNTTVSSQSNTNKFSQKTASVQLGVNALGLIKMYLGSAFLNEFTLEDSDSLQGYKLSGPSFQAGLQYKLFSYMNLGLQYNLNPYSTIQGAAYTGDTKIDTYYSKVDAQGYSFYLSTSF